MVELGWIALAALSMTVICRACACDRRTSVLVGWVATPLLLTGQMYLPGYTNLPGTALTLAILASVLRDRGVLAGAGLGFLIFLKLSYLPVALILFAIAVRGRLGLLPRALAGFAATAAAHVAVVAARGEWHGYIPTLTGNVEYAGLADSPVAHLVRVGTPQVVNTTRLLLVVLLVATVMALLRPLTQATRLLIQLCWGASLGVLVVLATTGMWDHHAQILYLVGCLLQALIVVQVPRFAWLLAAVMAVFAIVAAPQSVGRADPVETRAMQDATTPGPYARIGSNDDAGHAAGLRDWELVCPTFHQYPFQAASRLAALTECLPRAEYILVSPTGQQWLAATQDDTTAFGRYVLAARELLNDKYQCQQVEQVQICRRTPPTAEPAPSALSAGPNR